MEIDNRPSVQYVRDSLRHIAPEQGIRISPLAIEYLTSMVDRFVQSEALFSTFKYGPLERSYSL